MQKVILITGSTDGIGLQTAKMMVKDGHKVIIHGRNQEKLDSVKDELLKIKSDANIEFYKADLSNLLEVKSLANKIKEKNEKLDVLINNAGVYNIPRVLTKDNLDITFAVNTIAPYFLTKELISILSSNSRVVNLSSAAQARVDINAFDKKNSLSMGEAYAQSKLAITMWSFYMAKKLKNSVSIIAVNPKSFLATKMVKEAYGILGNDLTIGANILYKASLSKEFENASGKYFDNDIAQFSNPHEDALDEERCQKLINKIEEILSSLDLGK